MEYEIVSMPEKIALGITARTNNNAPDMGSVIGGLWESFYAKGYFERIPGDKKGSVLGIYSDYEGDERGDYDMTVACETGPEVEAGDIPEGMTLKRIPAGRYARFVVRGHIQRAVALFWQELWQMDLDRAFVADYEEYRNSSVEDAEIHIYIGLKDEYFDII